MCLHEGRAGWVLTFIKHSITHLTPHLGFDFAAPHPNYPVGTPSFQTAPDTLQSGSCEGGSLGPRETVGGDCAGKTTGAALEGEQFSLPLPSPHPAHTFKVELCEQK